MPYQILIVDDHDVIIDGYMIAIEQYFEKEKIEFEYVRAHNCAVGSDLILHAKQPFDLAMFDLNMPGDPNRGLNDGEDLAQQLKNLMPECRIMILSMTNDIDRLVNLKNTLDPKGIVVKIDLNNFELKQGLNKVVKNNYYYSPTLIIYSRYLENEEWTLDQYDMKILNLLNSGYGWRSLGKFMPISEYDIVEKRRALYNKFKVPFGENRMLIKKVVKKGIIEKRVI